MTIPQFIETVFSKWGEAIKPSVGNGYSMENSTIVNELPYATLFFMGLPTNTITLDGQEATFTPSVQVDIYTKGQKALSQAYEIDNLSHESLLKMRFRRSSGPELIQSTDPSIKRLASRYTRVVGYADSLDD